ncbi:hypothetical protein [Herpetosiphon giganteus]|uniref:hypothetical protein n=1 Tax=Herpetosiphon giganteus TaxID=2029754 RepID=UPI00195B5580|nr:hypothetical protein [Herpetosiphon giganteus]MBM7844139.1 hypothetical protein [Herpetosiphon giganteus]
MKYQRWGLGLCLLMLSSCNPQTVITPIPTSIQPIATFRPTPTFGLNQEKIITIPFGTDDGIDQLSIGAIPSLAEDLAQTPHLIRLDLGFDQAAYRYRITTQLGSIIPVANYQVRAIAVDSQKVTVGVTKLADQPPALPSDQKSQETIKFLPLNAYAGTTDLDLHPTNWQLDPSTNQPHVDLRATTPETLGNAAEHFNMLVMVGDEVRYQGFMIRVIAFPETSAGLFVFGIRPAE